MMKKKIFSLKKIALLVLATFSSTVVYSARANNIYFDINALELDKTDISSVNPSLLTDESYQPPGEYLVNFIINGTLVSKDMVNFVLNENNQLKPIITLKQAESFGFKPDIIKNASMPDSNIDVSLIKDSNYQYLFNQNKLILTVPQQSLKHNPRGYIDSADFDQGINAFRLNYNFTGSNTFGKNGRPDQNNYYGNIQSGLNIGAWRLRNYTIYSSNHPNSKWKNIQLYAQRDILPWQSRLTLGENYTSTPVFDSIPYRGIELRSDTRMLPDTMQGFAPVIRGIANTNALVIIKQSGNIIYQTDVTPGPFIINDLNPISFSDVIDVYIHESNGEVRHFQESYASTPIMEREGHFKYNFTVAKYDAPTGYSDVDKQIFTQASLIYGLPYGFTTYGGIIGAEHYYSGALGFGKSMGILGAISMSLEHTKTKQEHDDTLTGKTYRLQYAKHVNQTNTSFNFSGERASGDYYTLNNASEDNIYYNFINNRDKLKERLQFSVNQGLNSFGSLTFSLYQQKHQDINNKDKSIGFYYSNNYRNFNYGFSYNRTTSSSNNKDDLFSFNFSLPLSSPSSRNYSQLYYQTIFEKSGPTVHSLNLSSSALEYNQLNYNIQQNYTTDNPHYSGSLSSNYRGSMGVVNAGYSYDHYSNRVNYGISGSTVIHSQGVTLAQPLGETITLVDTNGVSGIRTLSEPTISTNRFGHAVLPNNTPYRRNVHTLDTKNLNSDVDVDFTSQTTIPTAGAITRVSFVARKGNRIMLTLTHDGKPVPFGSTAIIQENDTIILDSIVGEQGQVYFSGAPENGKIIAKWGSGNQCAGDYTLTNANNEKNSPVYFINIPCK